MVGNAPVCALSAEPVVRIWIDGEFVQFNDSLGYPFIDENSRTQVPFRVTLEKYGATVGCDQNTYTATAEIK